MTTDPDSVRQRLQQALAQIELALVEAAGTTATVMLDQSSVGRLSRMDAMQQQVLAQEMRGGCSLPNAIWRLPWR
ncbi:MAG: hypothetical protein K2X75_14095 [Burkholderiaceae bacterium]|jgi:DnaK suppressor protein|nr:hypothetical protein [Burkholderiaceae bacterium]